MSAQTSQLLHLTDEEQNLSAPVAPFNEEACETFKAHFPDKPCLLKHDLNGHPAFQLSALTELAKRVPDACREFHAGDIHVSQPDAEAIPTTGLTFDETLARIETLKAWTCIRSVQNDPDYRDILEQCIANLAPAKLLPGQATHMHDGFVFTSSPGTQTPFHFDPEYNVLMQIKGEKTVMVFPVDDEELTSGADHEELHATGKCNIAYDPARFDNKGQRFVLKPGDALYMPVKAPHWVKNGDEMSVSFSITWRSEVSDQNRRVHMANRRLRAAGLNPPTVGGAPVRETIKALAVKLSEKFAR